jgi:hypothetical protein
VSDHLRGRDGAQPGGIGKRHFPGDPNRNPAAHQVARTEIHQRVERGCGN